MRQALPGVPELACKIIHRIQSRTHGLVRELHVELADQSVVIKGRTRTHYARQLAEHGAMDLLCDLTIDNQIEVV